MSVLAINLFPNEGTSTVTVVLPDGKQIQVQVSADQFIAGWTAAKPPFGNNNVKLREPVSLQPGVRYEAPTWSNNDLRGKDVNGKSVLIERNGRSIPPRAGELPAEPGTNETTRYLNIVIDINNYTPTPSAGDLDI